jgi:genome maintenance exonuclease 1
MKKFNFVKLDETILPTAKGKNQDGFRFYSIDGKNYPSVTSVLGIKKKKELANWRQSIGENVANWEMGRAARRGKSTHTLVEQYLKGETPSERSVLPLGLFKLMRPYVDQIDNIHMIEQVMYSKELGLAGQTDCIAEYNGKLSVIDFKTANKERKESWIDNYFLQCTAYATMYKELYGKNIDQIVVLIASEDGAMQSFIKETKDYMEPLKKSIEEFYKYFHEQVKNKTS